MNKLILFLFFLCLTTLRISAQTITYGSLFLTNHMDQLRFEVPGEDRYWFMSKTKTDNKAFALFSPDDGGWFTYWKSGSGDMVLAKGNLGIGTDNPVADLHIASQENNGIVIGRPNDPMGFDGGSYDIKFYGYRDATPNAFSAKISAERTNGCCNWLSQGTDLTFHTTGYMSMPNADNSFERMRITASGQVGIGTSTPDPNFKLSVNGSIRSKEVKVDANWSDFVFYDNYKLRTLEEVEQHINEKGHLPEIPSEAEVTKNGINVGEMNAKLLQKIEELTLYLIEQHKENKAQQAKIEQLTQRIIQLEKQ